MISVTISSPTTTLAGTAMRRIRTIRLWRRAERNARSASPRLMVQYERVVSGPFLRDHTAHAKPGTCLCAKEDRKSFSCPHHATCRPNMAPTRQQFIAAISDSDADSIAYDECEKMSSAAQPARSSRARSGRKRKQAAARSPRPSRASIPSSFSFKACRCRTSVAA